MFTPSPLAPVSKPLKACFTENRVFKGLTIQIQSSDTEIFIKYLNIIMTTIMMGKMEMELPDMYMMNKFMGTCKRIISKVSNLIFGSLFFRVLLSEH